MARCGRGCSLYLLLQQLNISLLQAVAVAVTMSLAAAVRVVLEQGQIMPSQLELHIQSQSAVVAVSQRLDRFQVGILTQSEVEQR